MFYLSTVYQGIKTAVAAVGAAGSVTAIIYGVVIGASSSGMIYIIGGSIWLAETCFIVFDSSAVTIEIRKQVDRLNTSIDDFEKENVELKFSISELNSVKTEFVNENRKLATIVSKSEKYINRLGKLNKKFEEESVKYQNLLKEEVRQLNVLSKQNVVYVQENEKLISGLEGIKKIKDELIKENGIYQDQLEESSEQLKILEKLKDDYITENDKLKTVNEIGEEQLITLTNQVNKLRELYNNSRELLINLATAGDIFTSFNDTLNNTVVDISNTVDDLDETQEQFDETLVTLRTLINKLKGSVFEDFDKNGDGSITKVEFDEGVNSTEKTDT